MLCDFQFVSTDGERYVHRCKKCKREVRVRIADPDRVSGQCGLGRAVWIGPGTELLKLFKELRVKPTKKCGCAKYARKMDKWGVDDCRERRAEIVAHLKEKATEFGLTAWVTAGALAVLKGYPRTLAGLVDLAIERATAHRQEAY